MEEDKIVTVAKKVLDNLKDKYIILENRLEFLEKVNDSDFTPINPTKKFEEDPVYVMNEKDLSLNNLKNEIDKLEGQIVGQGELIHKLSEAGIQEKQEEIALIQENSELKSKVEFLEKQIEDGKEESSKEE